MGENRFVQNILKARDIEMHYIYQFSQIRTFVIFVMQIMPAIMMVTTFLWMGLDAPNGELPPAVVFEVLTLINTIYFPLVYIPFFIAIYSQNKVAFERIAHYLQLPENENFDQDGKFISSENPGNLNDIAIKVTDCEFQWETDEAKAAKISAFNGAGRGRGRGRGRGGRGGGRGRGRGRGKAPSPGKEGTELEVVSKAPETSLKLANINFELKQGDFLMVVGAVGSGKSSLISAILGEMHRNKGDLTINGSVAYCSQQAWIVNDTLRYNVLFGLDMDEERYQKIIQACALTHDIELLPGGDMTEIGERGINLSGGQKQRVSLARALYSDRDIYFFDDPLSAVDAHVGKHIFEEATQGVLKEKTRIMVTNQLQYLPFASQAIFMSGMEILEQGPPDVLMQMDGSEGSDDENNSEDNVKNGNGNGTKKRRKGEFQRLMKSQGIFQEEEEEFNQKRRKKKKDAKTQMNQEDLIEAEDREEGAVGITVMGYWIASGTMVLFLLGVGFILLQ